MKLDLPYLKHIITEIDFILEITNNIKFEDLISDELLKRGVTRSFEIIGEAVKNLSPALIKNHKEIDWKRIAGMRDKIIHFYFGVNYDILWQVIKNRLPDLREEIQTIIEEAEGIL